ncbi:4'-phosphopantetheinyl transferase [Streptomyces sp. NPDC091259]|uniref:4'-phosphopantetheinyl transferase family protein n=1 Tax=Streptomyces sp. NPDC091259 TaxID=3365976 RepID=UPI0037F87469
MLSSLLPPDVVAVEVRSDPVDAALFPEEAELVRDAVPKRREEFTAVRWCARVAMARLGLPAAPVLPGERGAPTWDPSVTGSMTHCKGYRAAALAPRSRIVALGIDAEPDEPLPEGILDVVALGPERRQVAALLAARPELAWDRLLFSIKESVFKTWYPLTGRELGFHEALVVLDPDRAAFHVRLLTGPAPSARAPRGLRGRWAAQDGLLVSAIAHTAGSPASLDEDGGIDLLRGTCASGGRVLTAV